MTTQEFANQLLGEFKKQVMQLLNETADEFDKKPNMSDAQRNTYNDFTGSFGNKILQLHIKLNIEETKE